MYNEVTMKKKITILYLSIPFLLIGCSPKESSVSSVSKSESTSVSTSISTSTISSESSEPVISSTSSEAEISSSESSESQSASSETESLSNQSESSDISQEDQSSFSSKSSTEISATSIPNYVLHGLFEGESDWTNKEMTPNPYSATEYMIQGVTLRANDVFKIHMDGDTWYGYSAIKTSTDSRLVTAGESDDNIKVCVTGVYDIYCDYEESDYGHIYIGKVNDESNPSIVSVSGISLSNTGKYLLVRNEFVITPTIYPNNATNQEVIWQSSDESITTVTSGGKVIAKEKRGSATITARTLDGGFTATCLVYVSPSQYPDYCLTGTIRGSSYSGLSVKYAAIPLDTSNYLIPDVDLLAGDEITVTDNYGGRLRDKNNQIYTKAVKENMSVNVYLNLNDTNKDYLSFMVKETSSTK